jgi:OmpA-OmpF porin, OOP family
MHPKQVLLAAATALLALPALAQNAYFELGAGRSDASVDCTGTSSCDDSDSFVRATAGYQFAPNWAVEFSVAQLGRIKAAAFVPGIGTVEATARLRSVGLGVAGSWPLADTLSLTTRLGVASNRTTLSGSASGRTGSDGDTNAAPYVGLALGYAFTPAWTASLTLDRTQAEYQGDKATVSTAGLALRYRF